jgi:SAM-dependent methyltransferase
MAEDLAADSGRDLDVFQCRGCGLIQLTGEPVPYFREVITAAGSSKKMLAFRQDQARDLIDRFGLQGGRVLEVGCGEGYFLDLITASGAIGIGLEAGRSSVASGRDRGRQILEGYLGAANLPEGPFDGFACINFLEHAPDPKGLLRGLRDQLVPGAPGLVEVPSFEHMLECGRFYDFIPDHLSYFTEKTLRLLLETSGFEVLACNRVWEGYDLAAYVRRRDYWDGNAWTQHLEGLVASLRAFLACHSLNGRKVAVWGASHQALTLLALARAHEVHYIVDSATFKQGRFTPVIHTPINPPEMLAKDPVDVVLVMAAGYSDEVVRILREERSFFGAIAVLSENAVIVLP